ncbi:hypothetical protein EVAR_45412_1 [Eumeta japonica]|uniref:Uncharacterized protein n=1 Tax=Eumeta variegata TaxID=151549 RepID=A0A4C1WT90_EUMVA|nr:hypothetical protein EVAR_45412_1 [Eumeta japonica]
MRYRIWDEFTDPDRVRSCIEVLDPRRRPAASTSSPPDAPLDIPNTPRRRGAHARLNSGDVTMRHRRKCNSALPNVTELVTHLTSFLPAVSCGRLLAPGGRAAGCLNRGGRAAFRSNRECTFLVRRLAAAAAPRRDAKFLDV